MKNASRAEPGGVDRLPDLGLVAVDLGGVDVAVAGVDRGGHVLERVLRRNLEDAEPELGDLRHRRRARPWGSRSLGHMHWPIRCARPATEPGAPGSPDQGVVSGRRAVHCGQKSGSCSASPKPTLGARPPAPRRRRARPRARARVCGRDAHRVPGREVDDLVVELDARRALDDDVDLFLLLVAVPERDPEVGREREQRQALVVELEAPRGRSATRVLRACRTSSRRPRRRGG